MNLWDRLHNPDRREPNDNIVPLVERRGGEERRVSPWLKRLQDGQLKGKSLDERAA